MWYNSIKYKELEMFSRERLIEMHTEVSKLNSNIETDTTEDIENLNIYITELKKYLSEQIEDPSLVEGRRENNKNISKIIRLSKKEAKGN